MQPYELLDLLDDPLFTVTDIRILNSEVMEVSYKRDEDDPYKGSNTNIFIADLPPDWPALNCTNRW